MLRGKSNCCAFPEHTKYVPVVAVQGPGLQAQHGKLPISPEDGNTYLSLTKFWRNLPSTSFASFVRRL